MKLISPPGALLTEVAGQLLESAQALGLDPGVVETTTGAEFGYGFTVPDDVFDHWFLRRGEARTAPAPEPEVFPAPVAEVVAEAVAESRTAQRRSRGVKPVTDGTEA